MVSAPGRSALTIGITGFLAEKDCMDNEELWQNAQAVRIAEIDTRNAIGGRFAVSCLHASQYQHEFGLRVAGAVRSSQFHPNGFEPEID